jgi:hypothetical protein
MKFDQKGVLSLMGVAALLLVTGIAGASEIPLRNWKPVQSRAPLLSDNSGYVMSFMPVTPCRIIDTRGGVPAPPFAGGVFAAAESRDYQFSSAAAPCNGLPAGARGFSINVTVANTTGPGFLAIYPRNGKPSPLVSTINYVAGQSIANAASVPTDSSGYITILCGVSGTHVIVDVNGYYIGSGGSTPLNPGIYAGFTGNYGSGGLLFARNDNTTSSGSSVSGVRGVILTTQNNPAGVWGEAIGATGVNSGVKGTNKSPTAGAAGVYGVDGTGTASGPTNLSAGVIGSSATHVGVDGISDYVGVRGEVFNGSGALVALGILGFHNGPDYYGVFSVGDMGGVGAKFFVEPHPADPGRIVRYVALEGPESGTYFRGSARTVRGQAVIEVPESFRIVSDDEALTVQLTPVGALATLAVMSQDLNRIVVNSSKDVTFHYLVQGVRRAFKSFEPITEGGEFAPVSPKDVMAAGLPKELKQRLIANGTYNADGTVNMDTAERMGWAQKWRDDERARQEAAAKASSEPGDDPQLYGPKQ